jgi:uncharacterized protein YggE
LSRRCTTTREAAGVASSRRVALRGLLRAAIAPTFAQDGRITGYEVTNEVTATLHDLAGAGALVDA